MDSPSALYADQSMMEHADGPPSSPFVTEVENSRIPSNHYKQPFFDDATEELSTKITESVTSKKVEMTIDFDDDKENAPEQAPSKKTSGPPTRVQTPEPAEQDERRASEDADLMPPPPSTLKKTRSTPKKTPLKSSKTAANTPKTVGRGNSFERSLAQSATKFQAGIDQRSAPEDTTSLDDSCFTAFSEIPEMTAFASFGQSPTKHARTPSGKMGGTTTRTSRKRSSPSRSPSPTPRRQKTPATISGKDDTTSFLIDFTQQMEGINVPAQRGASPTKSSTESNLLQYINNQRSPHKTPSRASYATPSKQNNILNLLDFELPPAPTPRSVPTITVRELESLKSSYLSQISSLKATLSGREAEVDSLKKAVGDAERRCGEAQEELREEVSRREHVEREKKGWEDRGKEVESVLQSVKEEVMRGEQEKEDMGRRLDEAEKRGEEAEQRAERAEERFAEALSARGGGGEGEGEAGVEEKVQRLVAAQIDAKIEAVSRELHSVYKEKHERKVGTLKKSYEARAEKKSAELTSRVAELEDQLAARDATFSGPVGGAETSMLMTGENSDLKAEIREQAAVLARLESEMDASKAHQEQLERELRQERIEKGDLVAAVDEMLLLQTSNQPDQPPTPAMSKVEDFRKSISRPQAPSSAGGTSGLPAPGSRIGKGGSGLPGLSHSRNASGGGQGPSKSRMLANIERMGRTGSGGM